MNATIEETKTADRSMEKARYWDGVLTGDMNTVPDTVKSVAGVSAVPGPEEEERLAGTIMRSWAVDHMKISREEAQRNWASIRKSLARELKTDDDDRQLFLALSEKRKVDDRVRERLYGLYSDSYNSYLSNGKPLRDGDIRSLVEEMPDHVRDTASMIIRRGADDAVAERKRLESSAETVWKGIQCSLANEGSSEAKGIGKLARYTVGAVLVNNMMRTKGSLDAVRELRKLDEEDRHKVYAILAPRMREEGDLKERMFKGLTRGMEDVVDHVAQFGANAYSLGADHAAEWAGTVSDDLAGTISDHSAEVAETARIYEELKRFAREEIAPIHVRDASWIDDALVDSASILPMTALAFGGPMGIGLLASSETGRQMADARQMNPDGDYESQMAAAVGSGTINTLLSLGMTRLGARIAENAFKSFRGAAGAGTVTLGLKSLGHGAAHGSRDLGMMVVENKLQELSQYGAQELAASVSGTESGVPWDDWKERNASVRAQLREAGAMFPLLMIGAGKVSLRHFKNAKSLLADGTYLRKFGIPESEVGAIIVENDIVRKNRMIRNSLHNSPLWGSLYLGKKAFEWAKILENPESPLFRTEQEARDFLEMGPLRKEKPWKKSGDDPDLELISRADDEFRSELYHERWMMRSGLPKVEALRNKDGSTSYREVREGSGGRAEGPPAADPAAALRDWHEGELRAEHDDLRVLTSFDPDVLPGRVGGNSAFDPNADLVRRNYLSSRLEDILQRPYRMLMLKYPVEHLGRLKWDPGTFDRMTSAESEALRSHVYEGVMRMAAGRDWAEETRNISLRMWSRWLHEDSAATARGLDWLRDAADVIDKRTFDRPEFSGARDVLESGKRVSADDLADAMNTVTNHFIRVGDTVRNRLPADFREMCRQIWKTQADARRLCNLIPNLPDFGIMVSRGFSLDQTYAKLLQRHLDIKPAAVARHADGMTMDEINPGRGKPRGFRYYEFMDDAVRLLDRVGHEYLEKMTGIDGQPLWRVKYPNNRYSPWHGSEQLARQDLASHLATVFTPGPADLVRQIPYFFRNGQSDAGRDATGDFNVFRLRQGSSGGALFDNLAERATGDLVAHYFGKRSFKGPGEEIIVHDNRPMDADDMLLHSAMAERSDVYRKYVGPIQEMGVDASNRTLNNNFGLLRQRLELYNHKNPLAIIEDKSEIMWDRFLRSGQLKEAEAWKTLYDLGRIDGDPASFLHEGHYMKLIEELSQLSKEYYLGNLDHPFVPPSVSAWGKYAVARPLPTRTELEAIKLKARDALSKKERDITRKDLEHIDEWIKVTSTAEMRNLAEASSALPELFKGKTLPDGFLDMLRDSACMSENARVERFWGLRGADDADCLPMSERYLHSIHRGTLVDVLPEHVVRDLAPRLAKIGKESVIGDSLGDVKEGARRVLLNLRNRLNDTPGLARWNRDPDRPGGYVNLVRKGDPEGIFAEIPEWDGLRPNEEPVWQKRIDTPKVEAPGRVVDDYYVRTSRGLPAKWNGRRDIAEAVEALSVIRDELSKKPLPTDGGIRWNGELYNGESVARPPSIPDSWHVDVPLMGAIEPIVRIGSGMPYAKGGDTPVLNDIVKSKDSLHSLVKYIDPNDMNHTVRLMPGIPEAPNPEARAPYVVHSYHGIFLDVNGRPVPPGELRRSYIPLELFNGTGIDIDMKGHEVAALRQAYRRKYLNELSDPDAQRRFWWDEGTGDSSVTEAVIRMYEELGMSAAYARGEIGLNDPAFVEMLRFAGHILNRPGFLTSSLEAGSLFRDVILTEGKTLKQLYREAYPAPESERSGRAGTSDMP